MKLKSLTIALLLSAPAANAAIIDNGTYTTDTATGLDWLDLTETKNLSYNYVYSQLGTGGVFEGWRYATSTEVGGFYDAFGGDSAGYDVDGGWSSLNNGVVDRMAPLWGDLNCELVGCAPGEGYSWMLIAEEASLAVQYMGQFYDEATHPGSIEADSLRTTGSILSKGEATELVGSALIRPTVVPLPPALWLFGSDLLGLVAMARRKKST